MLSESYKNRLKILSGILSESSLEFEYQMRNIGVDTFYKRVVGEKIWEFTTELDFYKNSNKKNTIKWEDNHKELKENVGPGPNDNRSMSNIFMDKFNQMFQSDDFKKEYNTSEYIFLDDEKEEIKNQNNLYDKEFKDISKKYKNFKRKKSWKNK